MVRMAKGEFSSRSMNGILEIQARMILDSRSFRPEPMENMEKM